MTINVNTYLNRIGISKTPSVTLEGLKELHRQHLFSIPFENLDIGTDKRILLDLKRLEHKIVNNNRGGFCFELNGLFCQLLKQLGFEVQMIAARVYNNTGELGPEFDHMALIVNFDKEAWLADVGFGDNFLEPLALKPDIEQSDPVGIFKVSRHDDQQLTILRKDNTAKFFPQIKFSTEKCKLEHFNYMCDYHQTSPESHFTQNRICSIATKDGRVTLSANKLIKTVNRKKTVHAIDNISDTARILQTYFHIQL